ncbi:MAG: TRAFs-binding domain-containing protein [Candidatus Ozemobacteraceae bacterium]
MNQKPDLSQILDLRYKQQTSNSEPSIESQCILAEQLIRQGEPLLAYDLVRERLQTSPDNLRLKQLLGFALARGGITEVANRHLLQLYEAGDRTEETIGLLARTYKDLWQYTSQPAQKRNFLKKAYSFYFEGFQKNERAYWTGINAATMAILSGKRSEAEKIARQVVRMCGTEIKRLSPEDHALYWVYATLGEAELILGNIRNSTEGYAKARSLLKNRWDDLASTRRNAHLLFEVMGIDPEPFNALFRLPPIAVFSGHMIDGPTRSSPRFPGQLASQVKRVLKKALQEFAPGFGYSSGACGGDILFLESVIELGGEINIVLPGSIDQFKKQSVEINPDFRWTKRFNKVMEYAGTCFQASESDTETSPEVFRYTNLLFHGLAKDRADKLGTNLRAFAVWDGKTDENSIAGTSGMVDYWRRQGIEVEIVNPLALRQGAYCLEPASEIMKSRVPRPAKKSSAPAFKSEIRTLLFADAVHFSHLKEDQISLFIEEFLQIIGHLLKTGTNKPLLKNTWGDGLFFVFAGVREAGNFALDLADRINDVQWESKGLPEGLNLRIALHAGPIIPFIDPVTGRQNYLGSHVNRAARIEPITPPGQVFASQAFAALSAAEGVSEFRWEYVGRVPLAKSFGVFPLYHIRRQLT